MDEVDALMELFGETIERGRELPDLAEQESGVRFIGRRDWCAWRASGAGWRQWRIAPGAERAAWALGSPFDYGGPRRAELVAKRPAR